MQDARLLGGRYQLLEIIGQGGMATVYRGREIGLNREVAIKVMASHLSTNPDTVERFTREAQIIANLQHPAIIQIYYYGVDEIGSYVVMPLLKGGTLSERMRQSTRLISIREAGELALKVGLALHHAHEMGIIHRDIKFSNIMFDTSGNPYVMDFGIARMVDSTQLTATGGMVGTPQFMAPEQWRGKGISAAVDQYAFALVLYELLTGKRPFEGETHELMYQHFEVMPEPVHIYREEIPQPLADVLNRALSKQPEQRFPSMRAFAEAFHEACQTSPVQSSPITPLPSRNISVTLIMILSIIIVVLLTALAYIFSIQGLKPTATSTIVPSNIPTSTILPRDTATIMLTSTSSATATKVPSETPTTEIGLTAIQTVTNTTMVSNVQGLVTNEEARVRASASRSSRIVSNVQRDDTVEILRCVTADNLAWYQVRTTNGTEGYMVASYVELLHSISTSSIGTQGLVTNEEARVRASASRSSRIVSNVQRDDTVEILRCVTTDNLAWYQVRTTNGTEGYMVASYVELLHSTSTSSIGIQGLVTNEEARVRASASRSSRIVSNVQRDDTVEILRCVTADNLAWYQVRTTDGAEGYMVASYIEVMSNMSVSSTDIRAIVRNNEVRVRVSASRNARIIVDIYRDDTVAILRCVTADNLAWYQVRTADGTTGYVVASYIEVP